MAQLEAINDMKYVMNSVKIQGISGKKAVLTYSNPEMIWRNQK